MDLDEKVLKLMTSLFNSGFILKNIYAVSDKTIQIILEPASDEYRVVFDVAQFLDECGRENYIPFNPIRCFSPCPNEDELIHVRDSYNYHGCCEWEGYDEEYLVCKLCCWEVADCNGVERCIAEKVETALKRYKELKTKATMREKYGKITIQGTVICSSNVEPEEKFRELIKSELGFIADEKLLELYHREYDSIDDHYCTLGIKIEVSNTSLDKLVEMIDNIAGIAREFLNRIKNTETSR